MNKGNESAKHNSCQNSTFLRFRGKHPQEATRLALCLVAEAQGSMMPTCSMSSPHTSYLPVVGIKKKNVLKLISIL